MKRLGYPARRWTIPPSRKSVIDGTTRSGHAQCAASPHNSQVNAHPAPCHSRAGKNVAHRRERRCDFAERDECNREFITISKCTRILRRKMGNALEIPAPTLGAALSGLEFNRASSAPGSRCGVRWRREQTGPSIERGQKALCE